MHMRFSLHRPVQRGTAGIELIITTPSPAVPKEWQQELTLGRPSVELGKGGYSRGITRAR